MSVVVAAQSDVGAAAADADRWIDLGEDPAWLRAAEAGPLGQLERVSLADARMAAAAELRRPFLDWIGELGVANDGPDWWATELAAKNVYLFLFQRLCSLRAAADLLDDRTLVTCSTAAVMDAAATLAQERGLEVERRRSPARGRASRHDAAYGVWTALPHRRPALPAQRDADTLLVTWVDGRSFTEDGAYRDPHFGRLPQLLAERGHRVALLARVLPSIPFRQAVAQLAASGVAAFLPEALLTTGDRRASWRRARRYVPSIDTGARLGGVPIAALARELIDHHRIQHAYALTYERVVARLAAAGVRPKRVIVPWEGHAWETALIDAARRHLPGAEVVAYDNLNFSSLALSLYPGMPELACRPQPDRIVTNGPAFARILEAEGIPRETVRVGCALRHEGLDARPASDRSGPVVAAGSIDASQTIELIEAAHAAFGDALVAKLHPASEVERIRREVRADVRYDERPISELLEHARAMLYTYSIVPYEALAAGVPPIFFRSETLLDLDQLEPTPDVRWVGRTTNELRAALTAGEAAAATSEWQDRALTVLADALRQPGPDCVAAFLGDAS